MDQVPCPLLQWSKNQSLPGPVRNVAGIVEFA